MVDTSCLVLMALFIRGTQNINPVAYRGFVETLGKAIQPTNDVIAGTLEKTITEIVRRFILYTYIPILIAICTIIIVLVAVNAISLGVALLLIIVAVLIFVIFYFLAMRMFERTLPDLTKQLQNDIFNAFGVFVGVVIREIVYLDICN